MRNRTFTQDSNYKDWGGKTLPVEKSGRQYFNQVMKMNITSRENGVPWGRRNGEDTAALPFSC